MQTGVSRREFVFGTAGVLVGAGVLRGQQPAPAGGWTAQQIVDRIKANVGVSWKTNTVDGFKAGDPSTVVTGIATTVMATVDVLRKAAAAHQNLIITQEPVFFSANDAAGDRAADPIYLAKKKLIEDQHLVVWRFSDHWSARKPNESAKALAAKLGWTTRDSYSVLDNPPQPSFDQIYRVSGTKMALPSTVTGMTRTPDVTLGSLVSEIRTKLAIHGGLRVVGNLNMPVEHVFLSPETTTLASAVTNLRWADVIVSGEPREWEAVPYTLDTLSTSSPKGMIEIGRMMSEGPGVEACAAWIRSLVTGVPVQTIATADPYWSPLS